MCIINYWTQNRYVSGVATGFHITNFFLSFFIEQQNKCLEIYEFIYILISMVSVFCFRVNISLIWFFLDLYRATPLCDCHLRCFIRFLRCSVENILKDTLKLKTSNVHNSYKQCTQKKNRRLYNTRQNKVQTRYRGAWGFGAKRIKFLNTSQCEQNNANRTEK